jgi:hypothetical protein
MNGFRRTNFTEQKDRTMRAGWLTHRKSWGLVLLAATATVIALAAGDGIADAEAEDAKIVPVVSSTATGARLPAALEVKPGEKATEEKGRNAKNARAAALGFTPEREAAAMMFVRTHHPELADLLTRLKDRRPGEYQKAVRDLFKASEKLAQSQEMHPNRYELELELWKLNSRVQLLVARLTMDRSPAMENELRELLARQLEVHEKVITLDRDRAAERVKSLDAELSRLASDRAQVLEEKFQKAIRSAGEKKQQLKAEKDGKSESRSTKSETK